MYPASTIHMGPMQAHPTTPISLPALLDMPDLTHTHRPWVQALPWPAGHTPKECARWAALQELYLLDLNMLVMYNMLFERFKVELQ